MKLLKRNFYPAPFYRETLHLAIDVANIYMLNIIFHIINEIIKFDLLLYYCVHGTLIEFANCVYYYCRRDF